MTDTTELLGSQDPTVVTVATAELEQTVSESEVELGRLGALSADLASYATTLESLCTVNQTLALSIESVCEGTINTDRFPIESFTQLPSRTNYEVTLEGIVDQLSRISKSIIEAIVKFLKRIGEFFMQLWNTLQRQEAKQEAMRTEIKRTEADIAYVVKNSPPEIRPIVEKAIVEASSKIDDMLSDTVDRCNRDLLHSIIKKDSVHHAVTAMGHTFIDYMKSIVERIVFLKAELIISKGHPEVADIVLGKITEQTGKLLHNNHTLVSELRHLHLLKSATDHPLDIAYAISKLKEHVSELYGRRTLPAPSVDTILNSEATKTFITDPEKISPIYSALSNEVKKLDEHGKDVIEFTLHRAIIQLSTLIRAEYHAATSFLSMASDYATIATEVITLELRKQQQIEVIAKGARRRGAVE